MIFEHTWQNVVAGQKTQTRRRLQKLQQFEPNNDHRGGVYTLSDSSRKHILLYGIGGKGYSVQVDYGSQCITRAVLAENLYEICTGRDYYTLDRRQKQPIWERLPRQFCSTVPKVEQVRVVFKRIWRQDARDITSEDALAEGFASPLDFLTVYTQTANCKRRLIRHGDELWYLLPPKLSPLPLEQPLTEAQVWKELNTERDPAYECVAYEWEAL